MKNIPLKIIKLQEWKVLKVMMTEETSEMALEPI